MGNVNNGAHTDPAYPGRSKPLRILLVDDYPDTSATFSVMLNSWGYVCQCAGSGAEALSVVQTFLPHVVFLDLELPDMSGLEVAKRVRTLTVNRPYIVAFTGYGAEKDREATGAAGFDAHLLKPSDPVTIRALLASIEAR